MPSGRSRTGLTIPKTPGSTRSGHDIIGIGPGMVKGVPRRIRRWSSIQRLNHQTRLTAAPKHQIAARIANHGSGCDADGAQTTLAERAGAMNGWLIESMTT